MLFNSLTFIVFHCIVVACYWVTRNQRLRLLVLLIGSLVFYAQHYVPALFILLVSIVVNYGLSLWIASSRKLLALRVGICLNLLNLAFFKYTNFVIESVFSVLNISTPIWAGDIWLPLGISFFTFQVISYLVDVYRGVVAVERSLLTFAVYKCFYGQLVAGPIVRAQEFLPQVRTLQRFRPQLFMLGIYYMVAGLFIKIGLADPLAQYVNYAFGAISELSAVDAWVHMIGFSFQILADFWGYSTIAIGIGYMVGLRLPLNFRQPYTAQSVRDFWRRWHITFSQWLRDFLYIPLGGNQGPTWRVQRNLLVTMVLGGLWHGANWTFVLWGLGHGLWLAIERVVDPADARTIVGRGLRTIMVFAGVSFLWVWFRAESVNQAIEYFKAMVSNGFAVGRSTESILPLLLVFGTFQVLFAASVTDDRFLRWSAGRQVLVTTMMVLGIVALAGAELDFIYFEF